MSCFIEIYVPDSAASYCLFVVPFPDNAMECFGQSMSLVICIM